jgi:hypothetical protein
VCPYWAWLCTLLHWLFGHTCYRWQRIATRIIYLNQEGEQTMDVILKQGVKEEAIVRPSPVNDQGEPDTTVEGLIHGYDDAAGGVATAADGSSRFEVLENGDLKVVFIAPSAVDGDNNRVPSQIMGRVDGDSGPGTTYAFGVINVTCLPADEVIATRIDYAEVQA